MKKVYLVLLVVLISSLCTSCTRFIAATSHITESATRSARTIEQVKQDLILEKEIRTDLKHSVKQFTETNAIKKITDYSITVMEGRVLLTGIVPNNNAKNFLYNKIWQHEGVTEVINALIISTDRRDNSFKDFWIARAIGTRLTAHSGIKSSNYIVKVVNSEAFVLGIAEDDLERTKVGNVVNTTNGVLQANIFVITKNDARRNLEEQNKNNQSKN